MSKGGGTTRTTNTNTQALTPDAQRRVDANFRQAQATAGGLGGLGPGGRVFSMNDIMGMQQQFMNPYQQQVIDATNADYDRSFQMGQTQAAQNATTQGAFGGSRHGIMQAVMGNLNEQGRNSALANLRQGGFNQSMANAFGFANNTNAWMNQMAGNQYRNLMGAASAMQGGVGPTTMNTTQEQAVTQPGGGWGSVLGGLGQIGLGLMTGGASTAATGLLGAFGNQAGNALGSALGASDRLGMFGTPSDLGGLGSGGPGIRMPGGVAGALGSLGMGGGPSGGFGINSLGGYNPNRWNLGGF